MTRRERLEAKAAKRADWAEKAEARAAERFRKADPSEAATGIPFGQPILVGHHSEGRHRRTIDRLTAHLQKGIEEEKLAAHHTSRADGLTRQLDTSIFSDDPDAVERLTEKRTELEERRDWMKSANAYYKKHGHLTGWDGPAAMARDGLRTMEISPYHNQPFPSFSLTNIGARIRAAAKRAASIPRETAEREARQQAAEAAGGVAIAYNRERDYCAVTFSEKPAREVLHALRSAYFCWSGGSWSGPVSRLPACVAALTTPPRMDEPVSTVASGSPVSPLSGGDVGPTGEATAERPWFRNFYSCDGGDDDGHPVQEWDNTWDSACNDKCDECGHEVTPYRSDPLPDTTPTTDA